ncbi:MAG TPA: nucleotidyl transferase AbiEii/AbiGii toxin family protein [Candidatus Aminicenantes bacterium]|nr:nucleotidyl transferase AbiEii/AbiGii toxin family protein [Candidatus Aminicenantes bacterium]
MFETVLSPPAAKTLKLLSQEDFLKSFYLAGGTGCALHIGHRRSQDFDFFSQADFEIFSLQIVLRNLGRFVADYSDAGTLVGRLDGTKISLIHYAYPLLEEATCYMDVRVASLVDIGCMKIDAISSRGTKRDFVDLLFILKTLSLDLKTFFGNFERKYGPDGFNRHHVLKSLVYFEDADKEPDPEMLAEFSWAAAERFFVENVKAFSAI